MSAGVKNLKILKEEMTNLGIREVSGFDTSKDGWAYILEYPSDNLPLINNSLLKNIPKDIRDEAFNNIISFHPYLIDEELFIPRSFKKPLRYDFVLFKVENKTIVKYKTYELQGEGHLEPIWGKEGKIAYIKTVLSDVIKERFGTVMIPFYNGTFKEKSLKLRKLLKEEIS